MIHILQQENRWGPGTNVWIFKGLGDTDLCIRSTPASM